MPIQQSHNFKLTYSVPQEIIYKTLTDQMEICRFTQGQAISELKEGGKLMMYDNMIQGEYTSLDENKKIEMKWRMKDWAEGVFSDVKITFEDAGDHQTEVTVDQTEIPEYDTYNKFVHLDNLEQGWRQMIFKRIEQVFGYPLRK